MREIKFRAWDTENNCYLEHGFDFRIDGDGYVYRRTWGESVWDRAMNLIPEQATDLKDKNGKEAYHKDIVKTKYGTVHSIDWRDGGFYYSPAKKDKEGSLFCVCEHTISEDEIIGNIRQNPKLMEKK